LNYYINKHIAVKLNYSYFIPGSHIKEIESTNFSVVQGRFQFIF
jgi:phosphate-selective porin OprO/OprP